MVYGAPALLIALGVGCGLGVLGVFEGAIATNTTIMLLDYSRGFGSISIEHTGSSINSCVTAASG